MTAISTIESRRIRSTRALVLAGSAMGALLVPMSAQAQNLAVNTTGDYSLTETGTRDGGPRTVDVTTDGNIALSFGTVTAANSSVNNGAGIAANSTAAGNVTVAANAVTTSGTNQTYGIYAQSHGGDVSVTSGTINATSSQNSQGINVLAPNRAITINADVTNGSLRGIYTGGGGNVFPASTTITSNVATASGTGQVNAIIAQGLTVDLTSGTARLTNTAATSGTALYVNSGSATVRAGLTEALGQNQAGIWAYADSGLNITSDTVNVTQNSYGFNIVNAGDLVLKSNTVTSTGASGASGMYIAKVTNSSNVTSGSISTAGTDSYGIWYNNAGGNNTIASGTITTAGDNSQAINIVGATGLTKITSDKINTAGEFSYGMFIGSTGAVDITSGTITTTGQYSEGIMVDSSGSLKIASDKIAATGLISSAIYAKSNGAIDVTSNSATSGDQSIGIYLSNRGASGTLNLNSGEVLGARNGIATYGQDATTVNSGTISLVSTISSPTTVGYGISARSANGAVSVTSGTINGIQDGTSYGIDARAAAANAVTINSGTISAFGNGGFGIHGQTQGGALTIASTGAITTTGTTAANLRDGGAVNPRTAPTETHPAHGIWATSTTGPIAITNGGSIATSGAGAFGIFSQSTTGAITINSATVNTAGVGSQGVWAQTTDGNIAIKAGTTITTATGSSPSTGGTQDAVFGYSTGAGAVTVVSDRAETAGDNATAVGAVGGGAVNITSNIARTTGVQLASVYGVSRNSDVTIAAQDSSATGVNAYAVEGHADSAAGNVAITSGTANAAQGDAIYATAGGLVTINATSAAAHGDGGTGVRAVGGNVVLNVASASSNGATVTNAQTGVTYRSDAIYGEATSGTIDATIGSAIASGAGDAVHLVANGQGGKVTARITGEVRSTGGTGLWIDPPGDVSVNIASGARVSGLTGVNTVSGGTNTIVNAGTIAGTAGPAILAAGTTVLDNSGVLTGGSDGVAVQLGTGNDRVTLRTGSSVAGVISGGGGTDSAVLVGTGNAAAANQTVAAFTGFDNLQVQSGYWTAGATRNAFNSATIASGASLELANGPNGIGGLSTPSIVSNGMLVIRTGANAGVSTFGATAVTGTGGVRFTGTGTATLDGTNSLTNTGVNMVDAGAKVLVTDTQGGNFVSNGIFQIGTGGTSGSFTGDLVDNGTLIVNRSDAYTFGGALSGSGIFVKEGAGTITFGTGYAFTGTTQLNGGSIKLSGPVAATTELAVEGNGTIDFSGTRQTVAELAGTSKTASINIDGGSLTVDQDTNTSFAGAITGNGGFTKTGSGSLNFTGNSTYTGPTAVNEGRLAVNGSIVSPLTVNAGGTLGGTGTLGNTTIGSGGTWAPGNSIGMQTVNGNLTFAKGSVFAVEADAAGNADRVNATGTATIQGGTVQVLAGAGNYAALTNYTILTAAGGVGGKFDTVTSNLAFLSPYLNYASDRVTLSLARNDISFASTASTPNQRAVAVAVNGRGFGDALYNTVLVQSGTSARATFDSLSGELHASIGSELIDGGRRIRDAVLARGLVKGDGIGMWAQALQVYANSRAQSGLGDLSSNRTGVIGGVDYGMGGLRFGINGGYIDSDVTVGDRASNADVKTRFAGASLAWKGEGSIGVQLGGTYAWHDVDTRRAIGITGIAGTLVGETNAHSAQLFGEADYDLINGPLDLGLFARVSHDWTDIDGLAETGGAAALTVSDDSRQTTSASAGLRFGGSAPLSATLSLEPHVSLAYQHNWGDLTGNRSVRFGTGPAFNIAGAALGEDALDTQLGVDVVSDSGLRFGIGGFANASRQWTDYGAKASISLRF